MRQSQNYGGETENLQPKHFNRDGRIRNFKLVRYINKTPMKIIISHLLFGEMGFPFWKQRPFLFIRHISI